MSNELSITTLEKLKELSKGKVVKLQGWDDEPFVCRLKRPSLQIMCANNQLPNPLMTTASKLFKSGEKVLEEVDIADITKLQIAIAKASLLEPTFEEIESTGLTLTESQLSEIFSYALTGVEGLNSFRNE